MRTDDLIAEMAVLNPTAADAMRLADKYSIIAEELTKTLRRIAEDRNFLYLEKSTRDFMDKQLKLVISMNNDRIT